MSEQKPRGGMPVPAELAADMEHLMKHGGRLTVSRDMTLAEYVGRLPAEHRARREFEALQTQVTETQESLGHAARLIVKGGERQAKLQACVERLEDEAHDGGITESTMRDVHRVATDEWPVPGAALPARRSRPIPFIARQLANEFGVQPDTIAEDIESVVYARCGCPGPLEEVPAERVAALLFCDPTDHISIAHDSLGRRWVAWVYDTENRIKTGIGIHCEQCGCPTQLVAA